MSYRPVIVKATQNTHHYSRWRNFSIRIVYRWTHFKSSFNPWACTAKWWRTSCGICEYHSLPWLHPVWIIAYDTSNANSIASYENVSNRIQFNRVSYWIFCAVCYVNRYLIHPISLRLRTTRTAKKLARLKIMQLRMSVSLPLKVLQNLL